MKLETFMFLFRITENCEAALSEKMDNISHPAVIQECECELIHHQPHSSDVATSDLNSSLR